MRNTLVLTRCATFLGICITAPVAVWLLTQSVAEDHDPFPVIFHRALYATALAQAVTLGLFAPWAAWRSRLRDGIGAALLLGLIPLPVYCLCWLGGATTVAAIGAVTLSSWTGATGCMLAVSMIARRTTGTASPIVLGGLQVLLMLCIWLSRSQWTALLGI